MVGTNVSDHIRNCSVRPPSGPQPEGHSFMHRIKRGQESLRKSSQITGWGTEYRVKDPFGEWHRPVTPALLFRLLIPPDLGISFGAFQFSPGIS